MACVFFDLQEPGAGDGRVDEAEAVGLGEEGHLRVGDTVDCVDVPAVCVGQIKVKSDTFRSCKVRATLSRRHKDGACFCLSGVQASQHRK